MAEMKTWIVTHTVSGKKQASKVQATSLEEAKRAAIAKGYNTLSIKAEKSIAIKQKKVFLTNPELLIFLEGLYTIEVAEMQQREAMEYLQEISTNSRMLNVVAQYKQRVLRGEDSAHALSQIGFPTFITHSLAVGSEASNNKQILEKLISMLKNKEATQKKINNMLTNPKITLFFVYALFMFFTTYFMPETKKILALLDTKNMPEISKLFFRISDFAVENLYIYIPLTLIIVVSFYKGIYLLIAKSLPYLPKIKNIYFLSDEIIFFTTLMVAFSARIINYKAINFAKETMKDEKKKGLLTQASMKIEKNGDQFSEVAKNLGLFDKITIIMIRNAETTTNTDYYIQEIITRKERAFDDAIEKCSALINPILLLFTASLVITMYYAANAPLLSSSM